MKTDRKALGKLCWPVRDGIVIIWALWILTSVRCDRAQTSGSSQLTLNDDEQAKGGTWTGAQQPAPSLHSDARANEQPLASEPSARAHQKLAAVRHSAGRARRPGSQQRGQTMTSKDSQNASAEHESLELMSDEARHMLEFRNTPPLFVTHTRDFFVDVARYPLGLKLVTMQAVDSDGDRIEYSLQPANERDASPYFSIDSSSGELRLAHRKLPASPEPTAGNSHQNEPEESVFKRPGQLYFLNVVANDGKYNSVVELQIHAFNSSALGARAGSPVQLPAEGGRARGERLDALMRSKTSEFFDKLLEPADARRAVVYPNFVNPGLVRPDTRQSHELAPVELSAPASDEAEQQQQQQGIKRVASMSVSVEPARAQQNQADIGAEQQLIVRTGGQHQHDQVVLSAAIVVCSLLVIALVLLLFIVPLSVKRLRKRLKSVESCVKHEQLSHKSSPGPGSIVCSSLGSSADCQSSSAVTAKSIGSAPSCMFAQSSSMSQFTLASSNGSTRGAGIGVAPYQHPFVQRQSSLDSAMSHEQQHERDSCRPSELAAIRQRQLLAASGINRVNNGSIANPVYLTEQQQRLVSLASPSALISHSQPACFQQRAQLAQHLRAQRASATPDEQQQQLYYHINDDDFYATIQSNEPAPLGKLAPGAAESLVGRTCDTRAYLDTQCAAQHAMPPTNSAGDAHQCRPSSPTGSVSSRSSTRSLARFLSLPAAHSKHAKQQRNNQETDEHRRSLLHEFDQLLASGAATKTIARANNIEQEVRPDRSRRTVDKQRPNEREWEIERFKLKFVDILDEGQFGQVWRCTLRTNKPNSAGQCRDSSRAEEITVAVKTLKRFAAGNQRETDELLAEIELMKLVCDHPNVIRLLHCCARDLGPSRPVLLVMEYAELGKLQSFLEKSRLGHNYATTTTTTNSGAQQAASSDVTMSNEYCDFVLAKQRLDNKYHLTSRDLIKFIYHIAKGMEYVAERNIVHRDLASRNVLVSGARVCKIGDFGMARQMLSAGDVYERHSRNTKIPVRWMAPEVLLNNSFTTKSDVFSFGILMWEIVTLGSTPYTHLKTEQIVDAVARNGQRPARPDYCHTLVYNLMSSCWAPDPQLRPTFGELVVKLDELLLSSNEYIELDQYPDHDYYNIPAQLAPNELV